jgi:predicted nucleic acid-binding protein
MLVIDASAAVDLCLSPDGFNELAGEDLVAPSLIHFEVLSTPHEMQWRHDIPDEMADLGRTRHGQMPVRIEQSSELSNEAWRIADEFGWAKTYDAHYVALARLLHSRLATVDMRLWRGTERLGFVVTLDELNPPPKDIE